MSRRDMKLYVTFTSSYARIARILVMEKALDDRVEIIAATTRTAESPYYAINPSGRVPYLVREDGVGMEDSALIAAYLDELGGPPSVACGDWEARRLEALARSMMDGLAVWLREEKRPQSERSPSVLAHEAARARRMAAAWEQEIDNAVMHGPLNMAHVVLICALHLELRIPGFRWRTHHPRLAAWTDNIAQRPSMAATIPPL